jgi:hypothetical protein
MHHLKEFKQIKNENPHYSLIALEMFKGSWKNPLQDIEKGKVSRDNVLKILNMGYREGLVEQTFYRTFSAKLQKI